MATSELDRLRAENTHLEGELAEAKERAARVFHQHETDLLLRDAENTRHAERWKLATAPIAFVRTLARALLGDEDGGVRDWMRECGDGTLLEEWHAALAALTRLDATSDSTASRQPEHANGD